jgi:hypothetical protein
MPIVHKSIIVAAGPRDIAAYITRTLGRDAKVQNPREDSLYRLAKDGIGYVFLLRPQPGSETSVLLMADELKVVEKAFRAPTLKDAMTALAATPSADADSMFLIPSIERFLTAIREHFDLFSAIPDTPLDPPSAGTASPAPRGSDPSTPAQSAPSDSAALSVSPISAEAIAQKGRPAAPNRTGSRAGILPGGNGLLVLVVVVGAIVIGVGYAISRQAFSGFANSILSNSFSDSVLDVKYSSEKWTQKSFSILAGCKNLFFTCILAVDHNPDAAIGIVLGSYPASGPVDLGKIEKDGWAALSTQLRGATRLNVNYFKIAGTIGIRRYYTAPVPIFSSPSNRATGYGMQSYFPVGSKVYELTVFALSEKDFKANQKDIDDFIASIQPKP